MFFLKNIGDCNMINNILDDMLEENEELLIEELDGDYFTAIDEYS